MITAVAGGYQVDDHIARVTQLAASLDWQKIVELQAAHLRWWWRRYWSKCSISIGDELVEKFYYGAQYVMGCSSRQGSVAPGLADPWHLNGPICWSNKYTLDYNFEAPWWGVYSSTGFRPIPMVACPKGGDEGFGYLKNKLLWFSAEVADLGLLGTRGWGIA